MRSRGYYSVGEMAKMDCEAIEFPYDVTSAFLIFWFSVPAKAHFMNEFYFTEWTLLYVGDYA